MTETERIIQNWINQIDLGEIFQEVADKIWLKEMGFVYFSIDKSLEKYCK